MIDRNLEPLLRKALGQFPSVVVTGARQSGKTTLARSVLVEADYITFDLPAEAAAAAADPAGYLARHKEPIILDEFQYVPELTR
jgi:uncharacterized protein